MKNIGIASKLILLIMTSVTVIFFLIFGYNYLISRRMIVKSIDEGARNLALATVNQIDIILSSVQKVPESLSRFLDNSLYSTENLMGLLRASIKDNPEIYGSTIAFEPYANDENVLSFAPYCYRSKDTIKSTFIPYNYFDWDWYSVTRSLNRPVWTEPYYDKGAGNIIMSTYSVPFYKTSSGKRRFTGVVTADVSLSWLQEMVASIKIGQTGYGFLVTKNGTFVTHPDKRLIMHDTIFDVALARGDALLQEAGKKMTGGKSGIVPFNSLITGKSCWMVYAPLSTTGWSLGVLFPQDELMADITSLNQTVLLLGLVGFIFLFVVIVLIAASITHPLRDLARVTDDIATGDLDINLPRITSRDEVGKLAESFEAMKTSLKKYIQDLTRTTAAKERIESELKVAHTIQMDMLPKAIPYFTTDGSRLDIYATLEPAKEVGGDLYEFFFVDESHLCFAIGDVSGKGVPASLFMAITMTLIKTRATKGMTSDKVVTRVNQDLSLDNPSLMFVTLFLGIINIHTGSLDYCNAGHIPPYLIRENGDMEELEKTGGLVLGVAGDFEFSSKRIVLHGGDTLFLYTDGITESTNKAREFFSEKRLKKALWLLTGKSIREMSSGVIKEVRDFYQGEPQVDDITIMILKYLSNSRS